MPRALIIAYYWPPAGGGGVQRWLKFTKYLPEFDWQPIVYVPYNPQYPLKDASLMKQVPSHAEIIKGHIWEARRFYRRLKKMRHGKRWSAAPEMDTLFFRDPGELSWFGRLSLFLRSQLFVPDSRSLWIRPSVRRLRRWLRTHPVDVIISTGPPHSCHLIGMRLASATGISWVADFRDPWTDIDYFHKLLLTPGTRRKHERLQHQVMTTADRVITVSPSWAALFRKYGAQHVDVVTNGYDNEDFESLVTAPADHTTQLCIASVGTLEVDRNPTGLWEALRQLLETHPELTQKIELHFAGKTDPAIFPKDETLQGILHNHGYLPHREALQLMARADMLVLILNQGNDANTLGRIPGKLFEYLAFHKPILLLGNVDSDSARIVSSLPHNIVRTHRDVEGLAKDLLAFCVSPPDAAGNMDTSQYERKQLTGQLAGILSSLVDTSKNNAQSAGSVTPA